MKKSNVAQKASRRRVFFTFLHRKPKKFYCWETSITGMQRPTQ